MNIEVHGLSLSYAETYLFSNIKEIINDIKVERKRAYVLTGRGLLPRIYGRMDTLLSEEMGALLAFFESIEVRDGRMILDQGA